MPYASVDSLQNLLAKDVFHYAKIAKKEVAAARDAFIASYRGGKRHHRFTKVQLSQGADAALQSYFADHADAIANWFSVIAPRGKGLAVLKDELTVLKNKKLPEIGA